MSPETLILRSFLKSSWEQQGQSFICNFVPYWGTKEGQTKSCKDDVQMYRVELNKIYYFRDQASDEEPR